MEPQLDRHPRSERPPGQRRLHEDHRPRQQHAPTRRSTTASPTGAPRPRASTSAAPRASRRATTARSSSIGGSPRSRPSHDQLRQGTGATAGNTTMKVTIPWTGSDAASGIDRFTIQRQINGGSWTTLSSTIVPRGITIELGVVHDRRPQAGRRDLHHDAHLRASRTASASAPATRTRNYSDWAYTLTVGARLSPADEQRDDVLERVVDARARATSRAARRSTARRPASGRGFTFTGRAVSFVSTYRTPSDSFKVYVDGVLEGTMSVTSTAEPLSAPGLDEEVLVQLAAHDPDRRGVGQGRRRRLRGPEVARATAPDARATIRGRPRRHRCSSSTRRPC